MDLYNINTPEGTRDRLFAESTQRREIENAITGVFKSYKYSEIITPEIEFYDLFIQSGNPMPQESLLKIIDKSGKILVMRPDNTMPIARVVSTRRRDSSDVYRLYYNQTVFRSGGAHDGSENEIPQCGVELIGEGGINADVEVIVMAIEALEKAGVKDFHVELGHAGLFKAVADKLSLDKETLENIKRYIENKNFAALGDCVKDIDPNKNADVLSKLSCLFGGAEVLDEAEKILSDTEDALAAVTYLKQLYSEFEKRGVSDKIRFDLGLVQEIDYYTGVIFRGYVKGAADNVLSGGRYDNLLTYFGASAPATGFAINTNFVESSLALRKKAPASRLKIAITKGRLLKKSIEMFEKMGLDCTEVKNPGRKLVIGIGNSDIDVVMSKAPDVITYVEHGVCDMGIVGKDTILENGNSFYEVLDLGFGKCRFALAVKDGDDFYSTYKSKVIASKYPNVAKRFFAKKGMDISVIKIEGSVELAPLLDLADGIVDIVETGSTLQANGLVPIETVCDVSARLIINTASMKLYKDEIMDFIKKCESVIG